MAGLQRGDPPARWRATPAPARPSPTRSARSRAPRGPRSPPRCSPTGWRRAPPPAGFPADALTPDGDLLTLPHRHGADGFYACRLVRSETSAMTTPSAPCLFCRIVAGTVPAQVVHETPGALAFLDVHPARARARARRAAHPRGDAARARRRRDRRALRLREGGAGRRSAPRSGRSGSTWAGTTAAPPGSTSRTSTCTCCPATPTAGVACSSSAPAGTAARWQSVAAAIRAAPAR